MAAPTFRIVDHEQFEGEVALRLVFRFDLLRSSGQITCSQKRQLIKKLLSVRRNARNVDIDRAGPNITN